MPGCHNLIDLDYLIEEKCFVEGEAILASSPMPAERSPKGIRIPVSALRGRRPRPLDDGAMELLMSVQPREEMLPGKDSNLHEQVQSLPSCH
jgi:hypothetical protein